MENTRLNIRNLCEGHRGTFASVCHQECLHKLILGRKFYISFSFLPFSPQFIRQNPTKFHRNVCNPCMIMQNTSKTSFTFKSHENVALLADFHTLYWLVVADFQKRPVEQYFSTFLWGWNVFRTFRLLTESHAVTQGFFSTPNEQKHKHHFPIFSYARKQLYTGACE